MTSIAAHLTASELESRYRRASAPIEKSHFHALWLVAEGYDCGEVAELLSFSRRWVELLVKRYNEGGADRLGDQRAGNGTRPTILTPAALAGLRERLGTPPDDGGLWTAPKVAGWLARFHGRARVHDQRGWDALIAIEYTVQRPRPRQPGAATVQDRARLKKNSRGRRAKNGAGIRTRRSRSGRATSTASA